MTWPTPTTGRRWWPRPRELGSLDLLVNNASTLGPTPLPRLERYPLDELRRVYEVNTVAPLALVQVALPLLRRSHGVVVSLSSDAAVEAYEGWGGYGSSKSALDHLHQVLAAEEPDLTVYQFDPGDMRTGMHQAAFPGEDISDRPEAETVVPPVPPAPRLGGTQRSVPGQPVGAGMTAAGTSERFTYDLPAELEATAPPESRGLTRDAVRMLVAYRGTGDLVPSSFVFLPRFLDAGDLLVINTSGTIPAAIDATDAGGTPLVVHLSTQLDAARWVVEPRRTVGADHRPMGGAPAGVTPPAGGRVDDDPR